MRLPPDGKRTRLLVPAAIALIAIAGVVSRLPFLGNEFDWDEGVYWLSMQSMQAGHALYSSVYSSQPPAFLLLTEPPWALLGAGIAAARAVMITWGAIAVVAGGVIGWRLAGPAAAVVTAAALAVDPLMVRQSVVLQADGPATALGIVAVAFAAVAVTSRRPRWSALSAALAGAALTAGLLTKLLDIAVIPALLAALAGRGSWRRLLSAAVAGGVVAAAAILLPLHDSWQTMWNQAVGLHIDTRFSTAGVTMGTALSIHWPFRVLAVAGGVIGGRRHPRLVVTGAVWVVGAVAAMAATHPLWLHHAVAMSPGLALMGAAGASTVVSWLRRLPGRASLAAATAFATLLLAGAVMSFASGVQYLKPIGGLGALASALSRTTSASAQLLGDEQFAQALAHRDAPPAFVDTSNTRIYAEPGALQRLEAAADGRPPVCAVLFSSGRFAQLPGFTAWVESHYPIRLSLGGSASLYMAAQCR